jgi:ubiquinol-cytochrome c reductase cytochrome b subunit
MLRAITFSLFGLDAKFLGVVTMGGAIAILFVVPWLDRSPVKSMRYKGWMSRTALAVFVVSFIVLGYLGTIATTEGRTQAAQLFTLLYFLYFILMPFYTRIEATKPVPSRVVES